MTVLILGQNIQGLIAGAMIAKSGAQVTILDFETKDYTEFHQGYKSGPVTHAPFAMPRYLADMLGLGHYGFEAPKTPPHNPFQALSFYNGLTVLLEMLRSLDLHRPPYREKAWRDTWGTFQVGNILSQYDATIQDLFARAATVSLVELIDAGGVSDTQKESILGACLMGAKTDPTAAGSAASILPAMMAYEAEDTYCIQGSLHGLTRALKQAAMSFGAEIITDKTIRKIMATDGTIQSVIMTDESEYAGDVVMIDHDPVDLFATYLSDYTLPPNFMNRIRPEGNTKYAVRARIALNASLSDNGNIHAVSCLRAFEDFKADGGSQYPALSIVNVSQSHASLAPEGHNVLDVMAQYFAPDLDNDEAIIQAIKQSLVKMMPLIEPQIISIHLSPVESQAGQPSFNTAMPFLQLLRIFSGHHALAYDLPFDNAVMAGYGAAACAHPHVMDGGERAATLYQSLQENDKNTG